jgi:hypothetical protein
MNNRNQNQAQTRIPVEPGPAATPTYLNVFTVEEYENNGKTGKKWTKIGAAFPHKERSRLLHRTTSVPHRRTPGGPPTRHGRQQQPQRQVDQLSLLRGPFFLSCKLNGITTLAPFESTTSGSLRGSSRTLPGQERPQRKNAAALHL